MSNIPKWFYNSWRNTAIRFEGGYSVIEPRGWAKRYGKRDFWTYVATLSGQIRIRQGAWQGMMGAGDQVVLLPDHPFAMEFVTDGTAAVLLDFRVQSTLRAADPLPLLGLPAVVNARPTLKWRTVCLRVVRLLGVQKNGCGPDPRAYLTVRGMGDSLLGAYLLDGITANRIALSNDRPVPDWLAVVRQRMEHNFFRPEMNVSRMARESGYSREHVQREYRKVFGQSPAETLWAVRLSMACRKLDTDPGLSMSEIARGCGFKTPSHFSRMFHLRFGTSPRQWRDRGRATAPTRGGS
jgi:AraC-like DNA-binding protein